MTFKVTAVKKFPTKNKNRWVLDSKKLARFLAKAKNCPNFPEKMDFFDL